MILNLPKGIVYMGIAIVAGILATFAIHKYVAQKTYIAPVATGQVIVATADVSPGFALEIKSVKAVSRPKELIPPQAAADLKQVIGRVAIVPIFNGEPILLSKLAPEGTAAGMSSLLNENKRAMTVRVDDVTGVAGFLYPRDRVDVLADMKMPGSKDESFSKTILQNITVLSTGQIWEQKGDNKPTIVNTVTMELTPENAEILNLASNEGKIRLSLRNRLNESQVETSGVITSQLVTGMKRERSEESVQEPQKKDERTVEVIKGMERSKSEI